MCRTIISAHAGKLWVANNPGPGLLATGFRLPDTATWPSPLTGTSASVTEFNLMVAFMTRVGGHGGDQEPRLQ